LGTLATVTVSRERIRNVRDGKHTVAHGEDLGPLAAAEKVAQILPTLDVEGFLDGSANMIGGLTNLAGMLAEQIERPTEGSRPSTTSCPEYLA
jgi:hypothetical protein